MSKFDSSEMVGARVDSWRWDMSIKVGSYQLGSRIEYRALLHVLRSTGYNENDCEFAGRVPGPSYSHPTSSLLPPPMPQMLLMIPGVRTLLDCYLTTIWTIRKILRGEAQILVGYPKKEPFPSSVIAIFNNWPRLRWIIYCIVRIAFDRLLSAFSTKLRQNSSKCVAHDYANTGRRWCVSERNLGKFIFKFIRPTTNHQIIVE